jgi:uncharacterized protein YjbI with pentapeptide repeats
MTNPPSSPEPDNSNRPTSQMAVTPISGEDSPLSTLSRATYVRKPSSLTITDADTSSVWVILSAIAMTVVGLLLDNSWVGFSGAIAALLISVRVISPAVQNWAKSTFNSEGTIKLIGFIGVLFAFASLLKYLGFYRWFSGLLTDIKWDEFGSWAEWFGAVGQIMIAILAVYVAWRQYVISRDLTIQQNRITQQQTIDTYFQGVSDLALNEEGLLEDWPQERAIAEGRTAAILSSIDREGKAKILRFLSQSCLLTPLRRDQHLGRAILNGMGGYDEDRPFGIRVIYLGVMLAGADLSKTDLRWTELSEANMVRANLSRCDLVKANLARTILYEANLAGADLKGTRLFYGSVETASPRSRTHPPNYETGEYTGAVIEKADLSKVQRLSPEQKYYCCAWGGEKTRATIPGGCEEIPNKLGR